MTNNLIKFPRKTKENMIAELNRYKELIENDAPIDGFIILLRNRGDYDIGGCGRFGEDDYPSAYKCLTKFFSGLIGRKSNKA